MRSFTCDRCGKAFFDKTWETMWIQEKWKNPMKVAGWERKTIDLCPECEEKLKKWLRNEEDNKC